ncbi:MAG: hypothetical protein L6408_07855 [Nanoarchaeota archaeon]|nr:hypothetical protein [Nanoarchaeota archaeon]
MLNLNQDLAELIGAHIGDGTLYKVNKSLVWELRGSLDERYYYNDTISPLINRLFNLEVKSKFRSDGNNGVWGVQTSKKQIINTFLDYGFKPGNKTYTVTVPDYIFKSQYKIKRAFVRGLFDTDGCIRFDKINKQKLHNYPRIEFSFASEALIKSLKKLLDELNFNSFTWKSGLNSFSLCLAGKEKTHKWFKEVKPHNPKHLKKYFVWTVKGFYP